MITPELQLQLMEVKKNIMYEKMNKWQNHTPEEQQRLHEAHEAIAILADPTYTPLF